MKDLPGIADSARRSAEDVETALSTITDPPIDTAWITQARRELAGLKKAMKGIRDELANNLAKLSGFDERKSKVERLLAMERRKLTETDDPGILQEIRDRSRKIESELSDIEIERQSRLEPCFSWLLGTGYPYHEVIRQSVTKPTAIPATTRAAFSSS